MSHFFIVGFRILFLGLFLMSSAFASETKETKNTDEHKKPGRFAFVSRAVNKVSDLFSPEAPDRKNEGGFQRLNPGVFNTILKNLDLIDLAKLKACSPGMENRVLSRIENIPEIRIIKEPSKAAAFMYLGFFLPQDTSKTILSWVGSLMPLEAAALCSMNPFKSPSTRRPKLGQNQSVRSIHIEHEIAGLDFALMCSYFPMLEKVSFSNARIFDLWDFDRLGSPSSLKTLDLSKLESGRLHELLSNLPKGITTLGLRDLLLPRDFGLNIYDPSTTYPPLNFNAPQLTTLILTDSRPEVLKFSYNPTRLLNCCPSLENLDISGRKMSSEWLDDVELTSLVTLGADDLDHVSDESLQRFVDKNKGLRQVSAKLTQLDEKGNPIRIDRPIKLPVETKKDAQKD